MQLSLERCGAKGVFGLERYDVDPIKRRRNLVPIEVSRERLTDRDFLEIERRRQEFAPLVVLEIGFDRLQTGPMTSSPA